MFTVVGDSSVLLNQTTPLVEEVRTDRNSSYANPKGQGGGAFFRQSLVEVENLNQTYTIILLTSFMIAVSIMKVFYSLKLWYFHFIPESLSLLGIGVIFGCVMKYFGMKVRFLTEQTFFVLFLPPIIFEAVLHLQKTYFIRNLPVILIFGFIGTFFNFIFLTLSFLLLNETSIFSSEGLRLHPTALILFAILVGSIDATMVLGILGELHVNPSLYFIFLGESVINDGVIVVLFNYVHTISCQPQYVSRQGAHLLIAYGILVLVVKIVGSCILGATSGCLTCFVTKYTYSYTVIEPLLVLSSCYLTYLFDYSISWSGVFSLLFFGLIQLSYTFENISPKSRLTIKLFTHMTAATSESLIFLTIGYNLVVHMSKWYTNFNLIALCLCTLSRFLVVYTLSSLAGWFNWLSNPISPSMKLIIALCGMHGPISHSLVEIVKPTCVIPLGLHPSMLQTTVLFIAFVTVISMSILIRPLLCVFRMKVEKQPLSLFTMLNERMIKKMLDGVEVITGFGGGNKLTTRIFTWEKRLRRFLLREHATHDELVKVFGKIMMNLHYASLASTSAEVEHYLSRLAPTAKILTARQDPLNPMPRKNSQKPEFGSEIFRSYVALPMDDILESSMWKTELAKEFLQVQSIMGMAKSRETCGNFKAVSFSGSEVHPDQPLAGLKRRPKLPDNFIDGEFSVTDETVGNRSDSIKVTSKYNTSSSSTSSISSINVVGKQPTCTRMIHLMKTIGTKLQPVELNPDRGITEIQRVKAQLGEHLSYADRMRHAITLKQSALRRQRLGTSERKRHVMHLFPSRNSVDNLVPRTVMLTTLEQAQSSQRTTGHPTTKKKALSLLNLQEMSLMNTDFENNKRKDHEKAEHVQRAATSEVRKADVKTPMMGRLRQLKILYSAHESRVPGSAVAELITVTR
ncbi:putative sodium/hydrogen exchanger 3, partial [Opisthorchis viverrini]